MLSLETALNYTFHDSILLEKALTHPSAGGKAFQRLEFLGDRVLGLTIAQWLYDGFPEDPEGLLTKRLANMVNRNALHRIALSLQLEKHITADTETLCNSRVMADACEAILGAIYLDTGLESAQRVIRKLWLPLWEENTASPIADSKSALQEYLQGEKRPLPIYRLISQTGPSHQPFFETCLEISPQEQFIGSGSSKRESEQNAAQMALDHYLPPLQGLLQQRVHAKNP
jgi:ribonuclease-3